MPRLRLALSAALLAGLLYAGARPVGPLPPLRPLVDPWVGVWQLAGAARVPDGLEAVIPSLEGPVEVRIDERGVPHVFATTEADAWRAQGWLTARDRLFQLNLQWRATAGRLSEWVGPASLGADRRNRELGLARAAERQWAAMAPGSASRLSMEAFAEGVNAWIDGLRLADRPFEYRLLGVAPDRWLPQHTLYLFQQMGTVLGLEEPSGRRAAIAALAGWEAAEALVPVHSPLVEPIQPNGQFAPRLDAMVLPPPGAPDTSARLLAGAFRSTRPVLAHADADRGAGEGPGSNNWAVSPGRTAAGRALLAGDPHLALTLPSIWYELHLVVPGVLDVAGATIPGAPGVLIGYNRSLAWAVTNTGADVLDFYRETVDDDVAPTRYRLDGEWRDLAIETAEYRGRSGRRLAVDTLRFTHRGPMLRTSGEWLSRRWTLQEVVDEPHVWIALNRATTVAEGLAATAAFVGPAQNFLFADRAGTIAIRSTGYFPVRPDNGRGDLIRDGAWSASDWLGWQPLERYPFGHNPPQGYLASANQEPVDPRQAVAYLGSDWPAPWRAIRINQLLRADSAVTPEAMRFYQTDPGSPAADLLVPHLLRAGRAAAERDRSREGLARAVALLAEWDRRYTLENRRAVLFEAALQQVGRLTWDELIAEGDSVPRVQPGGDILAALLEDPRNPWWDDRRTPEVEHRDMVLARALERGLEAAVARYGAPGSQGWRWAEVRQMNIHHLLHLRPLSRLGVPIVSGTGTLSPSGESGTHGASWRMIVELGDEVRAWTTYPGGQSGNPLSRWYANRVGRWMEGDLADAAFPREAGELASGRTATVVRLSPGGSR